MQKLFRYIAIEGPIGVGKTTLCRKIAEEFHYQLALEDVHGNPFLADFYRDRSKFGFQTQIFFLLSRYRQQIEMTQHNLFEHGYISDYLFAKDRLFATLNLSYEELELYESIYALLSGRIFNPDLVIFLQADIEVLEERIQRRNLPYEKNLEIQYLENLIQAYNRFFFNYSDTPLLVVNCSDSDFYENSEDYENLLREMVWMKKKDLKKHYITIRS